jgi:hypothetical protein
MGLSYYTLGANLQAFESYEKSLTISIKVFGEIHEQVAFSYFYFGFINGKLSKEKMAAFYT